MREYCFIAPNMRQYYFVEPDLWPQFSYRIYTNINIFYELCHITQMRIFCISQKGLKLVKIGLIFQGLLKFRY